MHERIGDRLIAYRNANNLTQEQVAEALDVTQQTVANWEKGVMPRPMALAGLLAMLGNETVCPSKQDDSKNVRRSPIQQAFLAKAAELVSEGKLDDARCVAILASWQDLL